MGKRVMIEKGKSFVLPLLGVVLLVGACANPGKTPTEELLTIEQDITIVSPDSADGTSAAPMTKMPQQVGSFVVHVDVTDPSSPVLTVENTNPVPSAGGEGEMVPMAAESVLTQLAFNGPGSYNTATHLLTATVRISAAGPLQYFDEPWMEVVMLTPAGQGITFQGIHAGTGDLGSKYYYADLAAGENNVSARQNIAIYDPLDLPFSFGVDVWASPYGTPQPSIFGDADDDFYNEEFTDTNDAFTGQDCDDTTALVYPSTGGCDCTPTCQDGCWPGKSCCEDVCAGGNCDVVCADTACECFFYPAPDEDIRAECLPDTTCHVISEGGKDTKVDDCETNAVCDVSCTDSHNCKMEDCKTGSECSVDCTDSHDCQIDDCEGGSNCELSCTDSHNCKLGMCEDASTCTATCSGGEDCKIDDCKDASVCNLDCSGSKNCWIDKCSNGSTCNITCAAGDDDCQIAECSGGSSCAIVCSDIDKCTIKPCKDGSTCSMDCTNTDECEMTCESGSTCSFLCDPAINDKCDLDCKGKDMQLLNCGGNLQVCGPKNEVVCP